MYHGACRMSEEYTRAVHVGALNPTGIRSVVPRIASTALHTARCPLCGAQSPAPCDCFGSPKAVQGIVKTSIQCPCLPDSGSHYFNDLPQQRCKESTQNIHHW